MRRMTMFAVALAQNRHLVDIPIAVVEQRVRDNAADAKFVWRI